jgi:hypothetical protein
MADRTARGMTIVSFMTLLAAFGVAMGYAEAVVVYYLRRLLDLVPLPDDIDPAMITQVDQRVLAVEQTREAATVIMLLALAIASGRNTWQRVGAFLFTFGVWDIFYYVGLKTLLGWPGSLNAPDLLFLIPRPWYAPVWMPILASVAMIVIGGLCIRRGALPRR